MNKKRIKSSLSEQHLLRLLVLAEHLESGKLHENYFPEMYFTKGYIPFMITNSGVTFSIFPIFSELPHLFPNEWEYWPDFGIITYKSNKALSIQDAMKEFFGLKEKQFIHCFVPNIQFPEFGGKKLTVESRPKEIANNLYCFLETIYPWLRRRVLVEKFKP